MSVYKYYKELPPWAKGAVIVGGITVTFLTGRATWRKVKSMLEKGKLMKEGKEAGQELINLQKQGINPTISDAQVEGFANTLQTAFSGCGTDEAAVINVVRQLKNEADVMKLIAKYGLRKHDACNWEFDFSDKEMTLSAAISDELDVFEKAAVNVQLEKNGIKYRFS